PEFQQVSLTSGRVRGIVRDDRGQAVGGVAISALGTTSVVAMTDATGRFVLPLPSGEYTLRAHREGYVSTYRDLVLVRPSTSIERTITITKVPSTPRAVMLAGMTGTPVTASSAQLVDPEHPHDQTAWYLRHLKRPVLRDTGTVVAEAARDQNFRPRTNGFFDWALTSSARLATSFFADTDFSGQVNFLTTSAIDPASGWGQPEMPRSVAYLSVSAPVGGVGDWHVRGAMNAADLSSWVLLGEFNAREDRNHAFTVGMAYSTQAYGDERSALISTVAGDARSVGAVYGSDRWKISNRLELDYGMRWDRYSYVVDSPNMVSPRVSGRAHMFGRTSFVGEVEQRMVAPGSSEFLAPAAAGPWLPPERTFSTLASNGVFRAERVRHYAAGVRQDFSGGRSWSVRRFRQTSDDQAATIFGLNPRGDSWAGAHYSVAAVGGAVIDGWTMRAEGSLLSRVTGSVEYALADANWTPSLTGLRRARAAAPSAVRTGHERLHDVLTSLEVDIPESDTRVSLAYRMNTAFSRPGLNATPGFGGRFDMQVNQALPFQPVRGGRLEVLVAVSNLLRDLRQTGSLYDELLTIAPPLRILGGVQIRF
ncbi:MAG: hypothetical protein EPO35_11975, partial [Acidobacteria bacterium]